MGFDSMTRIYVAMAGSCFWGLAIGPLAWAIPPSELSEEESQQIAAAERFLTVLERSPRFGTAFDRVYGYHLEFGTLDAFVKQLSDRTAKDATDSTPWMLWGMIEFQRGADALAINAFRQATLLHPDDALPSYYLGQALLRHDKNTEAVVAFEQAIARKPTRTDLLEISLQLGRVHQRAQRGDEALKVWMRLESAFPDDVRVLEQIATTLVEEESYFEALRRFERLSELVKDDYQRVLFRVQAASLKIKTNRRDEGIEDFEGLLANLNPTSWLYRDIHRRIEEVFLKTGEQEGLVKYYERWMASHPDDIEVMSRLAKILASSARMPEAMQWIENAIQRAPSRADLRKSYIEQLVDAKRIADALKQYEQLVATEPGNPDYMRDWGKLVLKDNSRELDVRKQEAARIWNGIVALRPNDASNLSQVAD